MGEAIVKQLSRAPDRKDTFWSVAYKGHYIQGHREYVMDGCMILESREVIRTTATGGKLFKTVNGAKRDITLALNKEAIRQFVGA